MTKPLLTPAETAIEKLTIEYNKVRDLSEHAYEMLKAAREADKYAFIIYNAACAASKNDKIYSAIAHEKFKEFKITKAARHSAEKNAKMRSDEAKKAYKAYKIARAGLSARMDKETAK